MAVPKERQGAFSVHGFVSSPWLQTNVRWAAWAAPTAPRTNSTQARIDRTNIVPPFDAAQDKAKGNDSPGDPVVRARVAGSCERLSKSRRAARVPHFPNEDPQRAPR